MRAKRLGRPPIVTEQFKARLCERSWNQSYLALSLNRRAVILNNEVPLFNNGKQWNISDRHLGNLLRKGGYRHIRPRQRMYNKRSKEEQLLGQQQFIRQLTSYKLHGLPIIYFDECTANSWSNYLKYWSNPKDPIFQVIPSFRGAGCTILGKLF